MVVLEAGQSRLSDPLICTFHHSRCLLSCQHASRASGPRGLDEAAYEWRLRLEVSYRGVGRPELPEGPNNPLESVCPPKLGSGRWYITVVSVNSAKSLGGSSTINVMAWTKPAREELDGSFLLTDSV